MSVISKNDGTPRSATVGSSSSPLHAMTVNREARARRRQVDQIG